MISFGELRRKSVEWQTELGTVEKIYALGWLLKGLFDRPILRTGLFLRGASALANAYFAPNPAGDREYPRTREIDLGQLVLGYNAVKQEELERAAHDAANGSGLEFRLHHFQPSEARFEFTGPTGRRSAAQPLIIVRLVPAKPRSEPVTRPLIHPFADELQASVRALSLEELAAERIVLYARKPRARDVFDLWFILTQAQLALDVPELKLLAAGIAGEKRVTLRAELDLQYAPLLERTWDNALQNLPLHPSLAQARAGIEDRLESIL